MPLVTIRKLSQSLLHQVSDWNLGSMLKEKKMTESLNPFFIRSQIGTLESTLKTGIRLMSQSLLHQVSDWNLAKLPLLHRKSKSQSLLHQVSDWNAFSTPKCKLMHHGSLNPFFIRSQIGTLWDLRQLMTMVSLNPFFIRSQIGTNEISGE